MTSGRGRVKSWRRFLASMSGKTSYGFGELTQCFYTHIFGIDRCVPTTKFSLRGGIFCEVHIVNVYENLSLRFDEC